MKNKFWRKQKMSLAQVCALAAILGLIFGANFFDVFFDGSNKMPEAKAAPALCQAAVDTVLIIDRSGSMDNTSRCDWWELKCNNPPTCSTGYTWTKNLAYNETQSWCNAKNQSAPHQSVYLAIDPKKIVAAKDAADYFVGLMGTGDQSGLVSYASSATLDKGLSNNHLATQSAIDSLVASGATNIGDAINLGTQELKSTRSNPQAVKAMILLTDGMPNKPNGNGYDENPLDVAYAQSKATEAAAYGFRIFTIGLGDNGEIDEIMLQNIANATGAEYYHSPTQNDLQAIYDEIADKICDYSSIAGCKWHDVNSNGAWEASEIELLADWQINLSGLVSLSQNTDANGCYKFSGLEPGDYTISETLKSGWTQTHPSGGTHQVTVSDWNQHLTGYHFGNYEAFCHNDILDAGEACEIGDTQSCTTGEGYQGSQNCNNTCSGWGACISQSGCGDGVKSGNEECDGTDGVGDHQICSQSCTLTDLPYCGNSVVDPGEQCDNSQPAICTTQNGYAGQKTCNNSACLWDSCQTAESCGDGIKNGQEVCDDSGQNGQYGYCNLTCTGQTPSVCGNNQKEGNEACDDGNDSNGDGCSSVCQIETPSGSGEQADIAVTKSVSTSTADIGQNIIFKISVTNLGPDQATGVNLNDLLPLNLNFISASSTIGVYASSTGVWNIGDMLNNAIEFLELFSIIGQQAQPGSFITNNASVVLAIDPVPGNNSASAQVQVGSGSKVRLVLTISANEGDGSGKVTSDDGKINCHVSNEEGCLAVYDLTSSSTTSVTLTATPDSGSTFSGSWTTGPCVGSNNPVCQVTMDKDQAVNAHFSKVASGGGGGVSGGIGGGGGGSGFPAPPVLPSGEVKGIATSSLPLSIPVPPPAKILGESIKRLPATGFDGREPVIIIEIILFLLGAIIILKKQMAKY